MVLSVSNTFVDVEDFTIGFGWRDTSARRRTSSCPPGFRSNLAEGGESIPEDVDQDICEDPANFDFNESYNNPTVSSEIVHRVSTLGKEPDELVAHAKLDEGKPAKQPHLVVGFCCRIGMMFVLLALTGSCVSGIFQSSTFVATRPIWPEHDRQYLVEQIHNQSRQTLFPASDGNGGNIGTMEHRNDDLDPNHRFFMPSSSMLGFDQPTPRPTMPLNDESRRRTIASVAQEILFLNHVTSLFREVFVNVVVLTGCLLLLPAHAAKKWFRCPRLLCALLTLLQLSLRWSASFYEILLNAGRFRPEPHAMARGNDNSPDLTNEIVADIQYDGPLENHHGIVQAALAN